ncbi:STAS domain-containing protein [Chitinilyticum piscinae]|uniref:Anti-sigma factor antagonist n=1 Tax=Chitinilyticum piscinae TaxID=2866724 RepID=A0A8J7FGI4_9NEIS|nr:STAS domain-containing protein [Chitinilyticum piscinae]MBE9608988.1 STAS domain-containing protein [Chitinilyticum piscinae]
MQATMQQDGSKAIIKLSGSFTFEVHREFKQVTNSALERNDITALEIDLGDVDYMDSAALGMLLLLNERSAGRKISLVNCKGTVRSVLDIANFSKIFEIH